MKKIRLGILSAGRIVSRIMPDMHNLKNVEITAIAARDLERAQEAAKQYNIETAYGSYLELAESEFGHEADEILELSDGAVKE